MFKRKKWGEMSIKERIAGVVVLLLCTLFTFSFISGFSKDGTSKESKFPQAAATQTPQATTETNVQVTTTPSQTPKPSNQLVKVTRVIDGDTIEIEGDQRIRYIGIDTPETVDPRKPVQCFGKEASNKNKELVEGKEVKLEKDISETDKYGRLLRYVYVGDIFINDYLVRQGYAHASSYPPDIKYQDQFNQAQNEARNNNKGLWGSTCDTPTTQSTGSNSVTTGSGGSKQPSSSSCLIKGNISSSGERIYHMPNQRFYDKTVIDGSKGEKWFCSENEAIGAGWRKSKV